MAGSVLRLNEDWLIQRKWSMHRLDAVICSLVLHSQVWQLQIQMWQTIRSARAHTKKNQKDQRVLTSSTFICFYNTHLLCQMGMTFMETISPQQIYLTFSRFSILFFYIYPHFPHLKILRIMYSLLVSRFTSTEVFTVKGREGVAGYKD